MLLLYTSYPEDHRLITCEELDHIKEKDCSNCHEMTDIDDQTIHGKANNNDVEKCIKQDYDETDTNLPIPWRRLFTNPPFLVSLFVKFTNGCTFMIFYSQTVLYLRDVVREDSADNEFVNSMVEVTLTVSVLINGYLSEKIIQRGYLNRTNTRRMYGLLSGTGQTIGIFLIPLFIRNLPILHVLIYLLGFFGGFASGADVPLPAEQSKYFGAQMFAMLNIINMIPGIFLPNLVTMIVNMFPDDPESGWRAVFFLFASLSAISTTAFVCFVSADRQPFDYPEGSEMATKKRKWFFSY